jgi:uncharacterized membrane protein YhhN
MSYAAIVMVLLVLMLPLHALGHRRVYGVVKTLASLAFVAAGVALLPLDEWHGIALLIGLVLSLAGDVLLIPKGHKLVFLVGLAAFLSAHAAYCVAFVLFGTNAAFAAVAAVLFAVLGAPLSRWLMPHVRGAMRTPVIAYMMTITAMVTLAASAVGAGASPLLFVGAVLFYLSDILVARERFVSPHRINGLVGLPQYYAGQLLLIAGLMVPVNSSQSSVESGSRPEGAVLGGATSVGSAQDGEGLVTSPPKGQSRVRSRANASES